ncbi:MAG: small multi-drug export protein [Agathobaculum sp.]|uniref:COG2426 family protein n=1 Tax=Agathobaculum sp. TaxID=2048138 RepID=UPI0025C4178C|nr:small multi-drug export protein [Agathobaculum sp.]MCI7125800.1 small multi-drug export protein [Agathobaculum sp.]MDY3711406.1 small multi-drug export protein [Agathobaculum sp.]
MFAGLFDWLLGAGREIAVVIISMVPLVELRGAVPLGVAAGMPVSSLIPLAILGNMLPIPFLLVFGEKLLDWLCTLRPLTKLATAYKNKLLAKRDKVTRYARIGLFLFVAIPLPGTGAWSGAMIATLLKMPKVKALLSILCGVITAGIIMLIASHSVLGVAKLF